MSQNFNWPHHECNALWHFESNVLDSSGNGCDGSGYVGYVGGRFGEAAQFAGSEFITFADNSLLRPDGACTFLGWYHSGGYEAPAGTIMSEMNVQTFQYSRNYYGFRICIVDGALVFENSAEDRLYSQTLINSNSWVHWAVSFPADGNGHLYINGKEEWAWPMYFYFRTPAYLNIGRYFIKGDAYTADSASDYLYGYLDELAVLGYGMTAQDVMAAYSFYRGV